jgi:CheY-like chemotaxis protein
MTNGHILLVDDDDDIREVMQDVLAAEGYRVDVARDGAEALAKLPGAAPPALILLDMMMPNMDGEAFLRALRHKPQMEDAQVVVVSGSAGVREKATAMHVSACLVKPFELDELLGLVRRLTTPKPH